jgi:arsenate reductase-like glutaredoxin family protein
VPLEQKEIITVSPMQRKTLDVITLFQKAGAPSSLRAHAILKQASATAAAHATEDQASDHSAQTQPKRQEFELDVTEEPPTQDQLQSILQYIGADKIGEIIPGAKNEKEALKTFTLNKDSFQRPLVFPPPPPSLANG